MSELAQVLRHILPSSDPDALVDSSTGDDAAVYRIAEDRALVVTTDFFTPVVDDAFLFGQIAAANALSDLYAMGARPLFALNLLAFPRQHLQDGTLEEIVRGGVEKCREAGISILGGHSIDDPEPKYGLVAVGDVDPARMCTNDRARAGQRVILTKPLGTGIIATAIKAGKVDPELAQLASKSMATLNHPASRAMVKAGVRAATDVTGFGLLGHLRQLAKASGVSVTLESHRVPLLPGVLDLAQRERFPGGTIRNLADLQADVTFDEGIPSPLRHLLADAQTSGGLLMAVDAEALPGLLADLERVAPASAVIGETTEGPPGRVQVL